MKDSTSHDRWMEELREKAERVAAECAHTPVAVEAYNIQALLQQLNIYHIELEMQNRELREAQELLELSRRKYYELFHLAPVGYVTLTEDGRIAEVNLTICDLLEADRSDIQDKPFVLHVLPAAHATLYEHLSRVRQTRRRASVSVPLRTRSGRDVIVRLETVSVSEKDGTFRHFLVTMTNITDMVQLHHEMAQLTDQLKASERRLKIRNHVATIFLTCVEEETLRALLHLVSSELATRLAVIAVRDNGSFLATSVEMDESGTESFDAPSVSLRCRDVCRRWWHDVQKLCQPYVTRQDAHESWEAPVDNLLLAPIRYQEQFLAMLVAAGRDRPFRAEDVETVQIITDSLAPVLHARMEKHKQEAERRRLEAERQQMEEKLREAQKMEAIGRLAGGVAHDFNNSLQVILGRADLLLDAITPNDPAYVHAHEIQKAGMRSAELVRQLLTFSRRHHFSPRRVNLNESVESILKMLKRLIGEEIELLWKPGSNLWPVRIDPVHVDQILANLCVNARDAIQGVGRIVVETANVSLPSSTFDTPLGLQPGDYVMLSVADTGCGMDSEIVKNIFEPFFTTKDVGKGTGLGLSIVYSIVKQNHGDITVHSEKGHGTCFKIFLPRYLDVEEAQPLEQTADVPRGAGETVLVVEDDPGNLTLTGAMLERLGYSVLAAPHPAEALKLARFHTQPIHLLLTDVIMPFMDGKTLAENVLKWRPDIKILFMSGYTSENLACLRSGASTSGLLKKPFSREELARKVRSTLNT